MSAGNSVPLKGKTSFSEGKVELTFSNIVGAIIGLDAEEEVRSRRWRRGSRRGGCADLVGSSSSGSSSSDNHVGWCRLDISTSTYTTCKV